MKFSLGLVAMLAAAASIHSAMANDQAEYERRVANELAMLFDSLDRDRDAIVSREEARGDLNFAPMFNDIDVNRDGLVTRNELRGYLELRFGPHAADAIHRADTTERDRRATKP